jgi:hypothetical protein
MFAFLLGLFRMVWLFGKDHWGVVLENLALRQQLSIYKRKHKRPRFVDRDRWFWATLSVLWKDWRRTLVVVHPDTVVRWQRERFGRYWYHLSKRPGKTGRPPISLQISEADSDLSRSEPVVACTPNSRRTTQARNRGVGTNRVASPANRQATSVADLEDILEEPHRGDRCRRLLHRADDSLARIVCLPRHRA